MLDFVGVFSKGGALLWTVQLATLKHGPLEALNALIRACLLEERSGDGTFTYNPKTGAPQALKWCYHNVRHALCRTHGLVCRLRCRHVLKCSRKLLTTAKNPAGVHPIGR